MNYLQRKKRALISVHRSFIPSGYKRVEYLESTGTQWIDTGVINTNGKTTYETEIMNLKVENGAWSGARVTTNTRVCWGLTYNSNVLQLGYGSIFVNVGIGEYKNKWIEISQKVVTNNLVTYIKKNVITDWTTPIQQFDVNESIYLFTINNGGTPFEFYMSKIRMKYYKVYKEGVLVWNGIPCLDKNNRPCMYDTVSKKHITTKESVSFNTVR